MVDIKKLEKLSCLVLNEDVKESVTNSIDGIIVMIKEIEQLEMPKLKSNDYIKTDLSVNLKDKLYSKEDKVEGIHLEDTMFLAPKVIKK